MANQCEVFLKALFDDKPDGSFLLAWEFKSKKSSWFKTAKALSEFMHEKTDIYFGCSFSPKNFGPNKRCSLIDVAGIPGVWADVDFGERGHKKNVYPPTEKDALGIINAFVKPTIVIFSGHGLQAWWLFKEPWLFENHDDRQKASLFLNRWQATLRSKANEKGWTIDSTADLPRILRAPGTFNGKYAELIEVEIREEETDFNLRYETDDIEKFFSDSVIKNSNVVPILKESNKTGPIPAHFPQVEIRPDRAPSPRKWQILQSADDRVTPSWSRKRKGFKSPSEHDMALAGFAAQANWGDQEICDLLVSCDIHHQRELKHPQYYARTIFVARSSMVRTKSMATAELLATIGPDKDKDPDEIRKEALDTVSINLELKVNKIIRYTSDPPAYRLETEKGCIHLGEVENLIVQSRFRAKVAAATGKLIVNFKGIEWHNQAQVLLDACTDITAGQESTDRGIIKTYLNKYLSEYKPIIEINDAVIHRKPFLKNGYIHIFSTVLKNWITITYRDQLNHKKMGIMLRAFGAEPYNINADGKTYNVWRFLPFANHGSEKLI